MEYIATILILSAALVGWVLLDLRRRKDRPPGGCGACGLAGGCGQTGNADCNPKPAPGETRKNLWGEPPEPTDDEDCPDCHSSLPEYREEPPKQD